MVLTKQHVSADLEAIISGGGAVRAGGMPGGVRVGVGDQWHSMGSLFLCSVARCLGEGTCSQVDYPGVLGCICGRETKGM
jgi:hypothetical protein